MISPKFSTIYLCADGYKIYCFHSKSNNLPPLHLNRISNWLFGRQITLSIQNFSPLYINLKGFDLPNFFLLDESQIYQILT